MAYRKKFDIPVVGVSGSVGKTSTKEMLYAVLSQKYKTHKTQGNLNNELGVPLTLLAMPEDTEAAVIEMGISDFGEMSDLRRWYSRLYAYLQLSAVVTLKTSATATAF